MEDEISSYVEMFKHVWNFQLFAIDNSPITLGKIVIGFTLIVFGYFVARRLSRQIGIRVLRRMNLQQSLEYTLERVTFYVLYIFLLLFILQMLSIPITIFTVLGSALAIGIGFGSQNLVNNFISGLIVMVEQPVRVGDWIEIDGVFGQIEEIGGRCTYMRNLDNKQTIIPNSNFLEKAFVNWTLGDSVISAKVSVGVSYGSDVNLVRKLLLEAAAAQAHVMTEPEPVVLFTDFAENSLNFSLTFTMNFSSSITVGKVASDIRFKINELFQKNGVSMPFPHRQLLFDVSQPIPVSLHKEH